MWYEMTAEEKKEYSEGKVWNYSDDYPVALSENDKDYLITLPELLIKRYDETQIMYSHFTSPNFTGYVSGHHGDDKRLKEHFGFMKQKECVLSICGHKHIEGLGICYESSDNVFSQLLGGFMYYSYGEKKIKNKNCCVTIPALADNGQVNGFAVFNSNNLSVNAISLNTNRRFIL
jgi:hypothetical protein